MKIKFNQWSNLAKGELAGACVLALIVIVMVFSAVSAVKFKWTASKAWDTLNSGDAKKALSGLDAILATRPGFATACEVRAGLRLKAGKFEGARADYQSLTSSSDTRTAAKGHIGLGLVKLERAKAKKTRIYRVEAAEEALDDFKKAAEVAPRLGEAHLAAAIAHLWTGDLVACAERIAEAIQTAGFSRAALPHLYYTRGVALAEAAASDIETRRKVVHALKMKIPDKADEVFAQARRDFELVLSLEPDWEDPNLNLAVCVLLEAQKRAEKLSAEDITNFRKMIGPRLKALPETEQARLHTIIGNLYIRLGDIDKARGYFEKAADADPKTPVYSLNSAACHLVELQDASGRSRYRLRKAAREALENALAAEGLSPRKSFDGWLRVTSLALDDTGKSDPDLTKLKQALKNTKQALAKLEDYQPSEEEQAIIDLAAGAVLLLEGKHKEAQPLLARADTAMENNVELTRLVRRLNALPAIGAINLVNPKDTADMQPIVHISDVYIRSCAETLAKDQIEVTFNDRPAFVEMSGKSSIYAVPREALVDGKTTCKITITDTLGNSASKTFDFFVDGMPPTLDAVEPGKGETIPLSGTTFAIELSDTSSGVDLDSVELRATLKSKTGGGGVFRIITDGARQYDMKKLNTRRGDHLVTPRFKITIRRPLLPGTLKFVLRCKDKAGHEMQAQWQYQVQGN